MFPLRCSLLKNFKTFIGSYLSDELTGTVLDQIGEESLLGLLRLFAGQGYRGRFIYPDLKAKLMELQSLGLLYTQAKQRGVYLVPSLVRPNSFDPMLINMELGQMREMIGSGLLSSLSGPSCAGQ